MKKCELIKRGLQEGGAVSRVNIGSLITASVTSRHTSVIFKMASTFLFRYVAKDVNFPNVWIHLLPSSIRQSFFFLVVSLWAPCYKTLSLKMGDLC